MQMITTFDNTMLTCFRTCERLFYNRYIMGYREEESVHLHAGKCLAAALEAGRLAYWRDQQSEEESFEVASAAMVEAWGDPMKFAEETKNLRRMLEALQTYCIEWPFGETKIATVNGQLLAESHFDEQLGDYRYCGTPDAVIEYGGGLWLLDEKTTGSSLTAQWAAQWKRHGQFTGYKWGLGQRGIQIDGVIVRGIAIQKTQIKTMEVSCPRAPWMVEEWRQETVRTIEKIRDAFLFHSALVGCSLGDACTKFGKQCDFMQQCCSPSPDYSGFKRGQWVPMTREWKVIE